jgi:hypothetical protein
MMGSQQRDLPNSFRPTHPIHSKQIHGKKMKLKLIKHSLAALVAAAAFILADVRARAADLAGNVQGAGSPIAGSTVTLFAAGTSAPTQLAQGKADDSGAFNLTYGDAPADSILYVTAKGGTPKAAAGASNSIPI